jgi:hypothetical protein
MNHEKFIYHKTQTVGKIDTGYNWYLIDRKTREGVHFHGSVYLKGSMLGLANQYGFFAAGIECHKTKPHFEGHKPIPGHCIVTGGECYADGSSLQAEERLGDVNPDGSEDLRIWNVLHEYYGYWIEEKVEQEAD